MLKVPEKRRLKPVVEFQVTNPDPNGVSFRHIYLAGPQKDFSDLSTWSIFLAKKNIIFFIYNPLRIPRNFDARQTADTGSGAMCSRTLPFTPFIPTK